MKHMTTEEKIAKIKALREAEEEALDLGTAENSTESRAICETLRMIEQDLPRVEYQDTYAKDLEERATILARLFESIEVYNTIATEDDVNRIYGAHKALTSAAEIIAEEL